MKTKLFKFLRNAGENTKMLTPCKTRKVELNFHIVLMAIPAVVRKVLGSIDFPGDKPRNILRAQAISYACAHSTLCPVTSTIIDGVNETIANYISATPETEAEMYRVMNNGMRDELLALFQKTGNNNPLNSEAIIRSGAFNCHVAGGNHQTGFLAFSSIVSGTIDLQADGGGVENHFHEWRYSPDGITFITLRSSSARKTSLADLEIKRDAYFTHELFIKDVGQGVSQIVQLVVI